MAPAHFPKLQLVSKAEITPQADCALCLTEVPELVIRLICGHAIGVDCISNWLIAGKYHICPKCNYPLSERHDDSIESATRQPHDTPTATPLNASQNPGTEYRPYRPAQYAPRSSSLPQSPNPSPQNTTPISPFSRYTYKISSRMETTTTRAPPPPPTANSTSTIPFIPSDFGLPPPTVRPSLATLASPSRHAPTTLPSALLAGQGMSGRVVGQPEVAGAAGPVRREGYSSSRVRTAYGARGYVPYRPGSYSSVSDVSDD